MNDAVDSIYCRWPRHAAVVEAPTPVSTGGWDKSAPLRSQNFPSADAAYCWRFSAQVNPTHWPWQLRTKITHHLKAPSGGWSAGGIRRCRDNGPRDGVWQIDERRGRSHSDSHLAAIASHPWRKITIIGNQPGIGTGPTYPHSRAFDIRQPL
jgi:hypothetical protein